LKRLEEEIQQVKKLVADLCMDKQMLQDLLKKSLDSGLEETFN